MTRSSPAVFVLVALVFCGARARNPLVLPSVGLADPHVRVINNRIFMFATHDFSVNNSDFVMTDWWVWTTDNMVRQQHRPARSCCVRRMHFLMSAKIM